MIQDLSDNSVDSLPETCNAFYFDETTGQQMFLQLPQSILGGDVSGSSSDGGENADVELQQLEVLDVQQPAATLQAVEAVQQPQQVRLAPKRPSTLKTEPPPHSPQTTDNSNTGTNGGGKRFKEERSISRGPIQQVSSPQQPEYHIGGYDDKNMMNTRPQPVPSPVIVHPLTPNTLPMGYPHVPGTMTYMQQDSYRYGIITFFLSLNFQRFVDL